MCLSGFYNALFPEGDAGCFSLTCVACSASKFGIAVITHHIGNTVLPYSGSVCVFGAKQDNSVVE